MPIYKWIKITVDIGPNAYDSVMNRHTIKRGMKAQKVQCFGYGRPDYFLKYCKQLLRINFSLMIIPRVSILGYVKEL